jgi:pyruvate ferredoxin oxidoreductase beta subunit
METSLLKLPEQEYMLSGNRTCAGCSLGMAFRYVLKALEGNGILVVPASCLTVLGGMYPVSSARIPWLNVTFPSTAACASGVAAGLKALGKSETPVIGFAGDGGTLDIGIQALSGAAERGANILYICYDNEAYMNTGTQRSSATPLGVRTATTPVYGKKQHPKDMIRIMEAHGLAYIATACPSYPADLYDKVRKAKGIAGTRYIHITAPCPPGWVFPTTDTVKMGRLAVETGAAVLFEIENGVFHLTGRSRTMARRAKRLPIEDYLTAQRRFSSLDAAGIVEMQRWVDARWQGYVARDAIYEEGQFFQNRPERRENTNSRSTIGFACKPLGGFGETAPTFRMRS